MTEPTQMSLAAAAQAIRARDLSAVELLDACLGNISQTEPVISAFASIGADAARAVAEQLGGGGIAGPLHGVPIALKDLFFTEGVPTEANCEALRGFVPDNDATVVHRLRQAGAVIVGKTNTHELAFGVSCPASHNPWNPERSTGGSSGGSAASLAARQVIGALGTDTGGSVRIPSNCCGTTAIKTTRGAVPRHGVHLISWTYDTIGPMARTAEDCRILLEVIAGHSPDDPFSSLIPATTQFTFPVNGAGLPAIALPGGFASDGLPIGFQLIGRPFAERTLAAVGEAFQQVTDHHTHAPPA